MNSFHTPGPWEKSAKIDGNGNLIESWQISGPYGLLGEMNTLADAQLVASAPELLVALTWILEEVEKHRELLPESYMILGAQDIIRRARGEL